MSITNYRELGIFGLGLIPFVIAMNILSPSTEKIPKGYGSSIVALEFVSNGEQLNQVLSPLDPGDLSNLDKINFIDFGFMLYYSFFLFLFIKLRNNDRSPRVLAILLYLPPIILVSDFLENANLLALVSAHIDQSSEVQHLISMLRLFTWLKWGFLALFFACVGWTFLRENLILKLIGFFLFIPLLAGVISFILPSPEIINGFVSSVFLMFFLCWVTCFILPVPEKVTI